MSKDNPVEKKRERVEEWANPPLSDKTLRSSEIRLEPPSDPSLMLKKQEKKNPQ